MQKRYRLNPFDSLEDVMARSKDLAAEAIIECVKLVETEHPPRLPNPEEESTHFSMPDASDMKRFRELGHRLV